MKLILKRFDRDPRYTGGYLYIENLDGSTTYVCDTLEDTWRDLNGVIGIKEAKVYGQTCIPDGRYEIRMDVISPKYEQKIQKFAHHPLAFTKGFMPRLMNVRGFSGILIHTGNTVSDTYGCILVGTREGRYIKGGTSTPAFKSLYEELEKAASFGEDIYIKIVNSWT